jgi:HlyD family secretion protein
MAQVSPARETAVPAPLALLRPAPPSRRLFRWLLLIVALCGAALPLAYRMSRRVRPAPPPAVRTAQVRSGALGHTIRITGSTAAEHGVMLRAPFMGGNRGRGAAHDFHLTLQQLAAPGTRVKAGDVLAVFDPVDMRNRLDDMAAGRVDSEGRLRKLAADLAAQRETQEQQLRAARAAVETAKLDLQTAPVKPRLDAEVLRLNLEEAESLYQSLLLQRPLNRASREAQLRFQELDLRSEVLEENQAKANLERMTIRAPIDGLVVAQDIYRNNELAQVRNGDELHARQPFLQVVDPSSMIIEGSANQSDVMDLRIGAAARVRFDAYPGLELGGTVYSVSPVSKSDGWRQSYVSQIPVVIRLEGADPRVIPSLTVSADILVHQQPAAAVIPRAAVFGDGGNPPFAYVRTASGWEKRSLELGLANNTEIAVNSGLKAGETVALEEPPRG